MPVTNPNLIQNDVMDFITDNFDPLSQNDDHGTSLFIDLRSYVKSKIVE